MEIGQSTLQGTTRDTTLILPVVCFDMLQVESQDHKWEVDETVGGTHLLGLDGAAAWKQLAGLLIEWAKGIESWRALFSFGAGLAAFTWKT